MSSHTLAEWCSLADAGDVEAGQFWNNLEADKARVTLRHPPAYTQAEMLPEHRTAYQALTDFLGVPIEATGSSIRGYWRTTAEEDAIITQYGGTPKYSDFDFFTVDGAITKSQVAAANETLRPIAPYQHTRWVRGITFTPGGGV
jgi:hypothetical protein